jgi:recombination protein RecR
VTAAAREVAGFGAMFEQRFYLQRLAVARQRARTLAQALTDGLSAIRRCKRCRMLTDTDLCSICAAPGRDAGLLCVVESPADVVAVEQSASYRGRYFVLHGHLSPLDGIGPEQIGAREFEALLDSGEVREVILATNPTVEGEATAHFLGERAAGRTIQASRIAHGVPIGGELEYVDGGTLAHALAGRILQR